MPPISDVEDYERFLYIKCLLDWRKACVIKREREVELKTLHKRDARYVWVLPILHETRRGMQVRCEKDVDADLAALMKRLDVHGEEDDEEEADGVLGVAGRLRDLDLE